MKKINEVKKAEVDPFSDIKHMDILQGNPLWKQNQKQQVEEYKNKLEDSQIDDAFLNFQ